MRPMRCSVLATIVTPGRRTPTRRAIVSWVSGSTSLPMQSWAASNRKAQRASTECQAVKGYRAEITFLADGQYLDRVAIARDGKHRYHPAAWEGDRAAAVARLGENRISAQQDRLEKWAK